MLSTTSIYAIRALACLAATQKRAVLGRDLAELAEVPANYLTKILLVLKRAGLVGATRGMGGGYRLDQPAAEISLLMIVGLFDLPNATIHGCLLHQGQKCSEIAPCPAHQRWAEVRDAFTRFLETTTLDQISILRSP